MRDKSYHEDAIEYNETMAKAAEDLALKLDNEEIAAWCTSLGRQHRFHAERHRSSLAKMNREAARKNRKGKNKPRERWQQGVAALEEFEAQQESNPISSPVSTTEDLADTPSKSISEQQAEFAASQQEKEVSA